jgi:hypothetical protein
MSEYVDFLGSLDRHIGRENGFTVKQKAKELDVSRNRVHSWLWKVKRFDLIPIWSHKIPKKKEKLYCINNRWEDFNDTKTDLGHRLDLVLIHGTVHDKRAKQLRIEDNIIKSLKQKVLNWGK